VSAESRLSAATALTTMETGAQLLVSTRRTLRCQGSWISRRLTSEARTQNGRSRLPGSRLRMMHTWVRVHCEVQPSSSPSPPSTHPTRTVTGIGGLPWAMWWPLNSPRHLSGACSTGCRSTPPVSNKCSHCGRVSLWRMREYRAGRVAGHLLRGYAMTPRPCLPAPSRGQDNIPWPGGPRGVASNGPTSRGRVSVTSAGNDGARRGRATGRTNRGVGAGAIRGSRANDLDKRSKGICWSRDPVSLSLPNSSLSGQIMPTAISCKAITAEKSRVSLRTDRQAA
jgi:hypothetical protein